MKTVFSGGVRGGQAQVQGQAALEALFRIPLLSLQEPQLLLQKCGGQGCA